MNPKKKQIRIDRFQNSRLPDQYKLRNIHKMSKTRYLNILHIVEAWEEIRIRTNYLKLNKGFNRNGESKLISMLKKREYSKIKTKNRSIVIQHRGRFTKRFIESM